LTFWEWLLEGRGPGLLDRIGLPTGGEFGSPANLRYEWR